MSHFSHRVIIAYNNRMTAFLLSDRTDSLLSFSFRFLSNRFWQESSQRS